MMKIKDYIIVYYLMMNVTITNVTKRIASKLRVLEQDFIWHWVY